LNNVRFFKTFVLSPWTFRPWTLRLKPSLDVQWMSYAVWEVYNRFATFSWKKMSCYKLIYFYTHIRTTKSGYFLEATRYSTIVVSSWLAIWDYSDDINILKLERNFSLFLSLFIFSHYRAMFYKNRTKILSQSWRSRNDTGFLQRRMQRSIFDRILLSFVESAITSKCENWLGETSCFSNDRNAQDLFDLRNLCIWNINLYAYINYTFALMYSWGLSIFRILWYLFRSRLSTVDRQKRKFRAYKKSFTLNRSKRRATFSKSDRKHFRGCILVLEGWIGGKISDTNDQFSNKCDTAVTEFLGILGRDKFGAMAILWRARGGTRRDILQQLRRIFTFGDRFGIRSDSNVVVPRNNYSRLVWHRAENPTV